MSDQSSHIGRREFMALAGGAAAAVPFISYSGASEERVDQAISEAPVFVHEVTMAAPDIVCVEVRDPPIKRGAFVALKKPDGGRYNRWLVRPNPSRGGALDYCRVIGPKKMHLRFQDIRATKYLDRAAADDAKNYGPIGSRMVTKVYRKTMPYTTGRGRFNLGSRAPIAATSSKHFLYLKLSGNLREGSYTIRFPSGTGLPDTHFDYNDRDTRAISIRTTQNGHRPNDVNKLGYVSLWVPGAPDHGAIDFGTYGLGHGATFHVIDKAGEIVFTGSISLRIRPTEEESGTQFRFTYPNTRYTEANSRTVTNVTNANPAVVTSAGHGFSNGDKVVFAGMNHYLAGARKIVGMKQLNYFNDKRSEFTVANATADTFELSGLDSTNFDPFATDISGTGGNYVFRTYAANRAGTYVYGLDYSAFAPKMPGQYRVYVPKLGVSDPFTIDDAVHFRTARCSAAGEYHQRSGIALDGRFGYTRPVSFRSGVDRTIYKSMVPLAFSREYATLHVRGFVKPINLDQPGIAPWITSIEAKGAWGGWHDGGDWDSRITETALQCFMLMDVWEQLPEKSRNVSFGLPKSSEILDPKLYAGTDGLSDVLHSAIFLADFHRRMQEPSGATSGGTDHVEKEYFWEPSWLYRGPVTIYHPDHISTFAYAGIAAKLAKILHRTGFTALASTYRDSAVAAWEWAEKIHGDASARDNHYGYLKKSSGSPQGYLTDAEYEHDISVLHTGAQQYRMFAAACLFALTGGPAYKAIIAVPRYPAAYWGAAAWEASNAKDINPELQMKLRNLIVRLAKGRYVGYSRAKIAYKNLQAAGHNNMANGGGGPSMGGSTQTLIWAHKITGDPIFLECMQSNLAFVHGANQNGISLTNGIGIRNLTETLYRDTMATGEDLPIGLTSEGWTNKFHVDFSRGQSFISFIQEPNADTAVANLSTPPGDYLPQRELTPRYSLSFPLYEKLIECWYAIEQMEYTVQQTILPQICAGLYLHGWDGNAASSAAKD
jgi:endoglucanase